MSTDTVVNLSKDLPSEAVSALQEGRHSNPFSVLGPHEHGDQWIVRTFQPHAEQASLALDGQMLEMTQVATGLFVVELIAKPGSYYLQLSAGHHQWDTNDPYQFSTSIGELDHHLFSSGNHKELYRLLGANKIEINNHTGVRFVVWAPNANVVSVIGEFNDWDPRRCVMRKHLKNGLWEIFIPDLDDWSAYKFSLRDSNDQELPLKSDPFARYCEAPPGNASIVFTSGYQWSDEKWQGQRTTEPDLSQPMSIYEVHPGSWQWRDGRAMSYVELADTLIPYLIEMGFTHVEFLPLNEHPFTASWGYQPTGLYAPTQRFGNPDDFRYLVDRCHQAGLGVIMDWVPAHFPSDEHGLGSFDGTHLYEHEDPRQGKHMDWDTLIYNYGRNEVANFLSANALFWIKEFHLDGLRVDAVASMLYLDYSREDGEWIPNEYGGNQNLDAVRVLQNINQDIHAECGFTLAEESTSYDGVTRPVHAGGLGFTYKWNMGWMHDILGYLTVDPMYRKHHHNQLTFGMMYNYSENFTLPFSHDEVVHGKGSMLTKMFGDPWQARANLRSCYAFMYAYPGKKLLFMGCEFGQQQEWSHDRQLDWHLLDSPEHRGIQNLVKELNHSYKSHSALHQWDFNNSGFRWIDCEDRDQSVLSWYRYSETQSIMIVCNLTPVVRHNYRIGVDHPGNYQIVINTDDEAFGGAGVASGKTLTSQTVFSHDKEQSIELELPPLAVLYVLYTPGE